MSEFSNLNSFFYGLDHHKIYSESLNLTLSQKMVQLLYFYIKLLT